MPTYRVAAISSAIAGRARQIAGGIPISDQHSLGSARGAMQTLHETENKIHGLVREVTDTKKLAATVKPARTSLAAIAELRRARR